LNCIVQNLRRRGISLSRWAELNGFNYGYARQIVSGRRKASTKSGTALAIVKALNEQGLMLPPVDDGLVWPEDVLKTKGKLK
jgi:hypothetical protein